MIYLSEECLKRGIKYTSRYTYKLLDIARGTGQWVKIYRFG
jgi:hypothetical protein